MPNTLPLDIFKKNVAINHLNTMAVPCVAEYFYEATTEAQLVCAVKTAQRHNLPICVLSGGSNVLCPDFIGGLVLMPRIPGVHILPKTEAVSHCANEITLTVNAGENWHELVVWCLAQGFFGLENLALIPGYVGAAPIQNIGAYGVELANFLVSVRWFDCDTQCFNTYSLEQCKLGYRDSIFKTELKNRAIITAVTLRLSTLAQPVIHYKPLADYFLAQQNAPQQNASKNNATHNHASQSKSDGVTPQQVFEVVCQQRQAKLPNPKDTPNCGSFFKNPILSAQAFEQLKALAKTQWQSDVPNYPQSDGTVKIPAAWLIDKAGLKGQVVGELTVHALQALVLTNPQKRPLAAVLKASDEITQQVMQCFNIQLEREPQLLGTTPTA